jgi:hypothetical protein
MDLRVVQAKLEQPGQTDRPERQDQLDQQARMAKQVQRELLDLRESMVLTEQQAKRD